MRLDAKTYERAKARGRTTMVIDPSDPEGSVMIIVDYYDKETGEAFAESETISLAVLQDIRQKTADELQRLDTMITEITTTLANK